MNDEVIEITKTELHDFLEQAFYAHKTWGVNFDSYYISGEWMEREEQKE